MSSNSKIEWTDHTFNPWEGCQKVGPGCDHCYAEARNARFGGGVAVNWGPGALRRRTSVSNWNLPKKWDAQAKTFRAAHGRRQRVFCASLADVFDNAVDPQWRADLFRLIADTPNLDWLLLTKRIGNAFEMMREATAPILDADPGLDMTRNIWLGATIVNQEEAERDIPKLIAVPAGVRFLSMEPLLGPVTLDLRLIAPLEGCSQAGERFVDWVIVGGESGLGARPMGIQWARELRDQCAAAGVPFLFKQWGEWAPSKVYQSEAAGEFAFGDYQHERTRFVLTARYPRAFTAFGARCIVERVGKKAAGRLLDGREWNEVPS